MPSIRHLLCVMTALLLLPAAARADDVALGTTGYRMATPPGLRAVASDDALLQMQNADETLILQVNRFDGQMTPVGMGDEYHKGLAGSTPGLKLADQSWEQVAGEKALYRHYTAPINGKTVNFQVVMVCLNDGNFLLQCISHAKDLAALKQSLTSMRRGAPAATPAGQAGAAQAVKIGDSNYTITMPGDFRTVPNPDVTLQLGNQADDAVVQAMVIPDAVTIDQMVQRYDAKMRQGLGNLQRVGSMEPAVAGSTGRLNTYTAQAEGERVDIQTLFFVKGDTRLLLHVISQKRPLPPLRAILLSLAPAGRPATVATPASTPATPDPAWRTHVETDAGVQMDVPAGWVTFNSAVKDAVTFRGTPGPDQVLSINLQLLGKAHAEHRDLATSLGTLRGQINAEAGGVILSEQDLTLAGRPARVADYRLRIDGRLFRFRMLVIDLEKMVMWLSFVAPDDQFARIAPTADRVQRSIAPIGGAPADSTTGRAGGSDIERWHRQLNDSWDRYTALKNAGQGDTPEAQAAYRNWQQANRKLEEMRGKH